MGAQTRHWFTLIGTTLLAAAVLSAAACGTSTHAGGATSASAKPVISRDADGNPIQIPAHAPQRVVSLTATDSEMLGALNLESRVVAVDYYTDYPAAMASKPKITDANGAANVETIISLKPDLILSYGGETAQTDKQLSAAGIPVVDLPVANLSTSLVEIQLVGQLMHDEAPAAALVSTLRERISAVEKIVAKAAPVSVYMEVDDSTPGKPYVFGGGSFGDELIKDAGGTNIFASDTSNGGYPQVSDESIIAANPQIIVLTEDPHYGGNPALVYKRAGWSVISAVRNKRVYAINPDIIQRPGPRVVDGLEQLAKDLHPELFP